MRDKLNFRGLSTSNTSDNAEKEVAIKSFGGVDYSHSTLFVDTSRAVQMSNFIKNDGINQKRKGYREIYQFAPIYTDQDVNYSKVNGVWALTTSKFNKTTNVYDIRTNIIVQAGNKFYAMLKLHKEKNSEGVETVIIEEGITTDVNNYDSQYTLDKKEIKFPTDLDFSYLIDEDRLSYGVVADERLYILTGKVYLMIGLFGESNDLQIRRVEDDEYTYIPTTAINIPPNEYNQLSANKSTVLYTSSFDQVNMLNRKRKNRLLGLDRENLDVHLMNYEIEAKGLKLGDNGSYYDKDGKVVILDPSQYLNATTEDKEKPIVFSYTLDSIPFLLGEDTLEPLNIDKALETLKVYATGKIITPVGEVLYDNSIITRVNDLNELYDSQEGDTNTFTKVNQLKFYVKLDKDKITIKDGVPYGTCELVFNYNVIPNVGANSILVIYDRYTKQADRINGCRFGCMYGLNNQGDRLFVSGNQAFPNVDYHTVESYVLDSLDNTSPASGNTSLTYFGDLTYTKLGGTANAINGYAILGDGKMAIFKTLSGQEPTIYFRTASTLSETIEDVNGNNYVKITEIYPVQVGTIGEGSIGYNTIQNLNGDVLMVSSNGVFGIELDTNVASSQRLAKRRSRLIDPVITKYDLSKATCITFDDKFYLCLDDGKVFIADARYPIKLNDDLDNEFNYEWWEWNGIPARFFFILNDRLWFGTDTGMMCCFEELNYKDVSVLDIDRAGICVVEDRTKDYNDKLVISPEYISTLENMSTNDTFYSNDPIYALGFDTKKPNISIEENQIVYDYSNMQFENEDDKKHFVEFMLSIPNYTIVFDNLVDESLEVNKNYRIGSVLYDSECKKFFYEVYKSTGSEEQEIVTLSTKGFRVCLKLFDITDQPLPVCNVGMYNGEDYMLYKNYHEDNGKYYFTDEEGITVLELENKPKFNHFSLRDYTSRGEPLKIVNYNDTTPIITGGKFTFNKNVECYYITPPFDMGTRYYNKDLHKLIIVPDTLLGTSVDFGFKTSNYEKDFNAYTGKAFSFNNLDFDTLNFLYDSFAKVYVKTAKKKRWSYIQFFFKSDTDNNCKINNLTIIYTMGTKNKGVR